MQDVGMYRCDGCGEEYRVAGTGAPTVLCSNCEQVASPYGDQLARREYRIGYAKYLEARRQMGDAMNSFEAGRMALARGGFNDAASEFEDCVDHFTNAARGAESDPVGTPCERARKKATCLWQAVEWLSGATYATEQERTTQAQRYRKDAQRRLKAASDYGDLVGPKDLPAAEAAPAP